MRLVLILLLVCVYSVVVQGFFFRPKATEEEEDTDEDENTAADVANKGPVLVDLSKLPASSLHGGVRVELWNNVQRIAFEEASFLMRKETPEEQGDVMQGRYRPPPKDVPRAPDAVVTLERLHWDGNQALKLFPGIHHEYFAAVLTGVVVSPFTGLLKFDSAADDAFSLRLNGINCFNPATGRAQCSMHVTEGQRIHLQGKYYNGAGPSGLSLKYELFGRTALAVVPAHSLKHVPPDADASPTAWARAGAEGEL